MKIKDSYKDCYLILAEFLQETMDIQIQNTKAVVVTKYQAKKRLYKDIKDEEDTLGIDPRDKDHHLKKIKNIKPQKSVIIKHLNERDYFLDRKPADPSLAIKIEVENQAIKDRAIANEVAIAMEEMLQQVEKGNENF